VLGRILSLPKDVVRALVHAVTGGGHKPPAGPRPADAWELRHVQASQASQAVVSPEQDESHSHSHGHSHDHGDDG
jgi:hypothetical protein